MNKCFPVLLLMFLAFSAFAQKDCKELKEENKKLKGEMSGYVSEIDKLTKRVTELEKQFAGDNPNVNKSPTKTEKEPSQPTKASEPPKDKPVNQDSSSCQAELKRLNKEIKDLEDKNEELRGEVDEVKSSLASKEELLTSKDRQYQDLAEDLMAHTEILKQGGDESGPSSRVSFMNASFDLFSMDTGAYHVNLLWQDEGKKNYRTLKNAKKYLESLDQEVVMATNAGMFTPKDEPQGLYVEGGKEKVKLDEKKNKDGNLNFYLQPNGVFGITKSGKPFVVSSGQFSKNYNDSAQIATQSGPMLVSDGVINSNFKPGSDNRKIRSGVGVDDEGHIIFAISNEEVNFYAFARLFKEHLKCENALYLDGAISEMYLPSLDRKEDGGDFVPILVVTRKK